MEKKRIPIALDAKQHEVILQAAAAMGLTPSAYIRMTALERAKQIVSVDKALREGLA